MTLAGASSATSRTMRWRSGSLSTPAKGEFDTSHPEMQYLLTPSNAYTMFRAVAECFSAL
jgi:hypothetical protein